jgi:hypothetical protein
MHLRLTKKTFIPIAVLLMLCSNCNAQQSASLTADSLLNLPDRFFGSLEKKASLIERLLQKKTAKALKKMQRQEEKLYKALLKKDREAAEAIFGSSIDSLKKMRQNLGAKMDANTVNAAYLPWTDSIKTTLSFLQSSNASAPAGNSVRQKIPAVSREIQQLQNRLAYTEQLQRYIQNRQQVIQQNISQYTSLKKYFGRYAKQYYYYKAQVSEYKSILTNRKKAEATAMKMLNKIPAFKAFMDKYSYMGGLLAAPAGGAGYGQTNDYVAAMIQRSAGGPQAMQQIRANVDAAKNELEQLKSKLNGSSGSSDEMPGFKANDMKKRRFINRIALGSNYQFTPAMGTQPQVLDLGVQAAYKFSKNINAGIGSGYRLGLGKGVQRIAFSSEGFSLRSFFEAKLKGQLYANAGFEYQYNTRFYNVRQLQDVSRWNRVALAGISKKISGGKKLQGGISLLYNFLAGSEQPVTNPFIIRYGWTIK